MDPTGSFLLSAQLQSIYSGPPKGSIDAFTRVEQIKTAAGLVNVSKTEKTLESRTEQESGDREWGWHYRATYLSLNLKQIQAKTSQLWRKAEQRDPRPRWRGAGTGSLNSRAEPAFWGNS